MRDVPPELLAVIERDDFLLTDKSVGQYLRHGYADADVIEIARTGSVHKKVRDSFGESDYVWTIVGRDACGIESYSAGKVAIRDGKKIWIVITIHEAR